MLTVDQITQRRGQPVYSADGEKVGDVEDVFIEEDSGRPALIGISGGFLGMKSMVVPLEGAQPHEDGIRVAYPQDRIKDAPEVDGERISDEQLDELYRYYGIRELAGSRSEGSDAPTQMRGTQMRESQTREGQTREGQTREGRAGTGMTGSGPAGQTSAGQGTAGHGTAGAYDAGRAEAGREVSDREGVTLHEERLDVGKRTEQRGTARIRKYVESTPVTEDVELRRETASIEREPINRPVRDAGFSEEEVEVPLNEERPVAQKETYATERVSLDKETESHREQVSDEVRRERADIDEPDAGRRS